MRLWLRSSPNHKKIVFNGVLRAVFVVLSYIEGNKSSAYMQGWFGDGILIEVFENSIEGLRYSISAFLSSLISYCHSQKSNLNICGCFHFLNR